jgi:hypothetical protein
VFNDEALRRRGFELPSYYLVRPDGYIALCGRRLQPNDVRDWFRARLGGELDTIEEIIEDVAEARAELAPA